MYTSIVDNRHRTRTSNEILLFPMQEYVINHVLSSINNIIKYAIKNKIYKFDVSCVDAGGCSVTLNNDELHNNLSYERFYKILY